MTIQKTSIQARMPSNEVLALDYLRKLDKHRRGRMAAHIHISNLQPQNRREHHIRIAANSFDGLTKRMLGQLFVMTNADLMFFFKEEAREEVEAALVKLRFLFSDDPLMADDAGGITTFATWYNLGKDYERLVGAISRMDDDEHHRRKSEAARSAAGTQPQAAVPAGEPLTPQLLARVEDALSRADVSNLVRRQSVCGIVGGSTPQPVFQELFISIPDLRQTLLPKVNLASSPWLFQHLTETLDRRVLALLNKHDDNTLAGDISINLNVATLLSPDFLAFDDNLKQGMRGTIVIELQKTDIYADLGA
ncbi:MAG: hypothetical protein K2Q10_05470, partial [Rhodospirillales bacterium]|nr:hypothetical protein [Rhodospirillales bacterium]